jgi:signal transduction histidine kinase
MDDAPRPPLLKRVPPGGWMAISWCAVIAYTWSAIVLKPPPGGPLWHRQLLGLQLIVSNLSWAGLAMCGVVALSAGLLRRWPLLSLGLLLAAATAAASAPQPAASDASLLIAPAGIAVGFIAATRPRPVSIAAAAAAFGVLARYGTNWKGNGFSADSWPAAVVIAWLIGQSVRQNRLHAETMNARAEAGAVTAERLRIARELHDVVAHSMGVIAIQAGAARRVIDTQPAQAGNALAVIEATSRETLAGLGHTLGAPRSTGPGPDPAPAPLDPAPGLDGIARLAATAMGAGVRVDVRWRGDRRPLPADIDPSAFRIIQEAVTNVVRHAGTGHCQVIIDQRDDEVAIEVTDDGRGGAAAGSGYGIAGMRERAGLLGGELTAGPRPEGGFKVAARLPLPAPTGAR